MTTLRSVAYAASFAAGLIPFHTASLRADNGTPDRGARARIDRSYGKLPLQFEANQGQQPAQVKFLSRGKDYTVFLTPDGATLSLRKFEPASQRPKLEAAADLRLQLEGANPAVTMSGTDPLPGAVNYFIGKDPARWRTNVTTYAKVRYEKVYPGIDLVFYGNQRQLEYDFVLAPGAAPEAIRLAVEGADRTSVDEASGDLVLAAAGQEIRFHKPVVYQPEADGAPRQEVDARFHVNNSHVTFEVAAYDRTRALVVDPVLAYSTFLGGSSEEYGAAIAVDKQGNAYATGFTCSTNFPTTAGSYRPSQPVHGAGTGCDGSLSTSGRDAFVTKLNASGAALVYSTYLGGSYWDQADSIAVDSTGDAVVGGLTVSFDFPVTNGSVCAPVYVNVGNCVFQIESTCEGGQAPNSQSFGSFVTKLNPTGSALVWSTFMGGTGNDNIAAIALDSRGDVYIAANTSSSPGQDIFCPGNPEVNVTWPTTSTGYEPIYPANGFQTPFHQAFSKLSSDGTALLYSTLFGAPSGSTGNWDVVSSIAVDSAGKAYIGGYGNTTGLPVTPGAFQNTCSGCPSSQYNGFVAAFDPSQSGAASLVYSTYLGGNGLGNAGTNCGGDAVYGIAVDSQSSAYVTGTACSADFPTTPRAFQATDPKSGACNISLANAFLSKLNATGTALDYSTFLGGSTCAYNTASTGYGVSVNSAEEAFVTGYTGDNAFPTVNPLFPNPQYAASVFVGEFNPKGSALLFSTLLGACYECGGDTGYGVHADNYGNVYVVGQADQNSPLPTTAGAFQTTYGGGANDAFALRIALTQADLSVTNGAPSTVTSGTNLTYTIVVENNGPNAADVVTLTDSVPKGTTFVSAMTNAGSCKAPAVGAASGRVTCTVPSLSSATGFTVSMTVNVTVKPGHKVTDAASVSSLVFDPTAANNTATATTTVN